MKMHQNLLTTLKGSDAKFSQSQNLSDPSLEYQTAMPIILFINLISGRTH